MAAVARKRTHKEIDKDALEALELWQIFDWTTARIAVAFGVTERTIYNWTDRALRMDHPRAEKVRRVMEERDQEHGTDGL